MFQLKKKINLNSVAVLFFFYYNQIDCAIPLNMLNAFYLIVFIANILIIFFIFFTGKQFFDKHWKHTVVPPSK